MDKVYHYCTIETLKLILENKTIRLSRFDKMDDRTEIEGLPDMLKKNYFLSCWVNNSKEKIPQWAMYAPKGVRIELPLRWYKKHKIPVVGTDQFITELPVNDKDLLINGELIRQFYPLPFEEMMRKRPYLISPPFNEGEGFIVKVDYSEDFHLKKKETWSISEDNQVVSLGSLANPIKFKDDYWSFQEEIRYFLFLSGKDFDQFPLNIDLPIDEVALAELRIRLYPNCTEEDRSRVIKILFNCLPGQNIEIENSDLDGKYFPKW